MLFIKMLVNNLVVNIQKHEYKTGVKKAHSLVTETFDSMKVDVEAIYRLAL